MTPSNLTTGMRISLRGEDFLVINVEDNFKHSKIITAEGISELVRGKQFIFDTAVEQDYQVVHPNNSRLVADTSRGYLKTKLFIETHLRNSTTQSEKIVVAHKAAINSADYQYTPTLKAIKMPRPRILIADAVGLGKTVEVGIMITELMKRGKGKRILVIALKSILSQFQQEMWTRFAIPLVRLDSDGISRIAAELPLNKNPFDYYDKTIISIDTLKNNERFQLYIERTRWDIVVIDECHTVANNSSMRGELAQLLAKRCESIILTSATPHNGDKVNFANLIRMIEPISIPQSGAYTKNNVVPYYVRRFKRDLGLQDQDNFRDRIVQPLKAQLTPEETVFFRFIQIWKEEEKSRYKSGDGKDGLLFLVGILKAYLSSPEAALETMYNRLEKKKDSNESRELERLKKGIALVEKILEIDADSKFHRLIDKLDEIKWHGKEEDVRIILFAERIATLDKLQKRLTGYYKLSEGRVKKFDGSLTDTEQQTLVTDFGEGSSSIRLLISSDAGSQGVNLHYYCNMMFNYDIPWSFITLEQRNGRIDRYGQKNTPNIFYLLLTSPDGEFAADLGVLEKLISKEQEIYRVLGDSSSYLRKFSAEGEERIIEEMMISGDTSPIDANPEDFLTALFGDEKETTDVVIDDAPVESGVSLYNSDTDFYKELTDYLTVTTGSIPSSWIRFDEGILRVKNELDLDDHLFEIPPEARPRRGEDYYLTQDKEAIMNSIEAARKKGSEWPRLQMLYDLHPIIRMLMFKLEANIDKDVVPVAKISQLPSNTAMYLFHGQFSNRYGQAVLSEFFVIEMDSKRSFKKLCKLDEFFTEHGVAETLITRSINAEELLILKEMISDAVENAELMYLNDKSERLKLQLTHKMEKYKEALEEWRQNSIEQLEIEFEEKGQSIDKKRKIEHSIESILSEKSRFYEDLTSLDNVPYLKLLAVFYNGSLA